MANLMGRKMGQIMMICLISLMSTRSSALSDSRSVNDRLKQIDNPEDGKPPIKKAYTYVSEYKRLPVFNFGIGKRWVDNSGAKGVHPFKFGLGKRSDSANLFPLRLDYLPYDNYENYMSDDMPNDPRQQNKRGGRYGHYDFGVGKRMVPHGGSLMMGVNRDENEALKKHLNDDVEQRFLYGLRNRYAEDPEEGQEDD